MYRAEVKDQLKIQHLNHRSVARPIEPVRLGVKTRQRHLHRTARSLVENASGECSVSLLKDGSRVPHDKIDARQNMT